MEDNTPSLVTCKPLKPGFEKFHEIPLTSKGVGNVVTIGRGLNNSIVVPFLSISRNHCTIRKIDGNWVIEDNSTLGITVNGKKLGKGVTKVLQYEDVIIMEPSEEFVFRFAKPPDDFEIPRKRIKLEQEDSEDIFNNVKLKFEESQSYEIQHFQQKLQNAKNMQATSLLMKDQLESDMNKKIQMLQNDFALQIENLKGEKSEVEEQKALLIAERDAQLASVKQEMEVKITELMSQIQRHNETESELLKENSNLKEKLLKEREEFLAELNRESSSKQDLLDKLEAKMREQEEARKKEREELELMLRKETEQLRLAKEKELQELEELKKQREKELEEELNNIKKDLEQQIQQAAQEKCKAEQLLSEHMEQRKKLNDEDKAKMEQLVHEREEIHKKLMESEVNAENAIKELKKRVEARETELAALAAERIQQQADQSTQVITSLQEQLEKVKNELKSVETEKNTLLESIVHSADSAMESTSKESTLAQVGELMESELQCSICAELFVAATTLSCSHTFCKYCITMWKKKKKDCPICRAPITSECKSLVLDSFIDKMVQNLTEDMKKKREELLKSREELESELARQPSAGTSRRSHSYDESDYNTDSEFFEEGEEEELEDFDDYNTYWPYRRRRYYDYDDESSDTDSGSDEDADNSDERSGTAPGNPATGDAAAPGDPASGEPATVSDSTGGRSDSNGSSRRRGTVEGLPGAYYGGYGRCFSCGSRGHWAPGCPYR